MLQYINNIEDKHEKGNGTSFARNYQSRILKKPKRSQATKDQF
jgi:hypothetical protein